MKKISLNNYKNVMSESEMKMVKGGTGICGDQKKFYCITTYPNGFATSGYACGSGKRSVQAFIATAKIEQVGGIEGGVNVECNEA
ncbi:TIGR04149 family rSAM-modified RiPP [Bacteroides sp. OttesenSCG-928-E20]|nr:TIGR04149 family rSAM-modified RiPP [Bacteroides sp. OttesenSCG-928-E20]